MASKLQYHYKLYIGESITDEDLDKLKKKLDKKPLYCDVYLITICQNPRDQLAIFSSRELVQKYYAKHPVYVVGIASNHGEAVEIVEKIVQECLQARGDCALKEYLLCLQSS
jgi:hypothetical protein